MEKLRLQPDRDSKTIVITANGNRAKALGIIDNVKIALQNIAIPINLQVIESSDETLLLGTDWFNKSRAKLDFGAHTLHIRYLGKQATINTTHVTTSKPTEISDEFEDDDWIDELEDKEKETFMSEEAYLSDNSSTIFFNSFSEEEMYENPWEDLINEKNPATYLTGVITAEIKKDSVTPKISKNLTKSEIIKANETLMSNWDIFVKNISKEGQTM